MTADERRRLRLAIGLAIAGVTLAGAGLAAGGDGWSIARLARALETAEGRMIVFQIRAPRTVGAWLTGALLGLSGAIAQGLFRNPLAEPYLLGSASGAVLGVVLVLATAALGGHVVSVATADAIARLGLVGAAFVGALLGVLLTLSLARGVQETTRLLLAGVVVGFVLAALTDLMTLAAPDALRGKQAFMLGSTGFLGWSSCAFMGLGFAVTLPVAWRLSRVLDALTLGTETARQPRRRARARPGGAGRGARARHRSRGLAGGAGRVHWPGLAPPRAAVRAGHARLHAGRERRRRRHAAACGGRPGADGDRASGGAGRRAHRVARRRLPGVAPPSEAAIVTTLRAAGIRVSLGDTRALDGVTVDVQPGWTAIVGPNGAGKSTLLRVFAGLQAPDAGEVLDRRQAPRRLAGARSRAPDRLARPAGARDAET